MTDEQLQKLAALAEAATPGPWEKSNSGFVIRHDDGSVATMGAKDDTQAKMDAAFIAAARQAVPELLAEVSDLRRQLAEAQAEIAAFVPMRAAANAAIAEAADLHRQVDKLREQLLEAAFIPRFMK